MTTEYNPFLARDPEMYGQKFICISFIKPKCKDVMLEKEKFYSKEFGKFYTAEMYKIFDYKLKHSSEPDSEHFKKFLNLNKDNFDELYDGFVLTNKSDLDKKFREFYAKGHYNTDSAVKVRGTFATLEEAEQHAKELRDKEDGLFNIYVATMGTWLLFEPPAGVDQVYMDDRLNKLITEKETEKFKQKIAHEERVRKMLLQTQRDPLDTVEEEKYPDE